MSASHVAFVPTKYTAEEKRAIVTAGNGAMPGRLYDWGGKQSFQFLSRPKSLRLVRRNYSVIRKRRTSTPASPGVDDDLPMKTPPLAVITRCDATLSRSVTIST